LLAQTDNEIVLLFEKEPKLEEHPEIRLIRNEDIPTKILKRLKRDGYDLRKLQKLIRNSKEHIFLFTNYKSHQRPAELGVQAKLSPNGVEVTNIFLDQTKNSLTEGDIITAFNGRLIAKADDLYFELSHCKPGEIIRLSLLRGSQEIIQKIKLQQRQYYYVDSENVQVKLVQKKSVSRY